MVDWTKSMEQSYEYYIVDPNTWKDVRMLTNVKSSSINRDDQAETLGSASINITELLEECYIRVYLITIQNGIQEKHPLGTFLVQTPSSSFDGKTRDVSLDAYTPLIELKENPPPLGYSLLKDDNIMNEAYRLTRDNCRAPVVQTESDKTLQTNFISNTQDKWINYISDLIAQADYQLYLDEYGRILFAPKQKLSELQPTWTFTNDNSSILLPQVSFKHDLYGIPNVVEVISATGTDIKYSRIVNDDPNSPTSTIKRGREITYRDTNPELPGNPSQEQLDEYASNLLKALSSVEYQITYSHGYCPVRIGDCVLLNYENAGIFNVKAKVIKQTIKCETGCTVTETAVFTKNLWK